MGDRLEYLFQEWHRLGGTVLLSRADTTLPTRQPEELIAESTAYCRESGRLMWVVLDWLIHHIEDMDEHKLLRDSRQSGDLSVLGVLCDAARLRRPYPKFERIMATCAPHSRMEPFFHRVARSPLASRLARENALDVFRH